jgi:hypothetical protein
VKTLTVLSIAAVSSLLFACGGSSGGADTAQPGDEQDITKDACSKAALSAAETEYGNSPDGTKVQVLTKGKKYRVTVGIGNPEDGAHDYYVEFSGDCSSKPKVSEVPSLAHPLRDASHAAYDKLLWGNGDTMPASAATPATSLPAGAHKQYKTWLSYGTGTCSDVGSFKVTVSGQDTFGVTCTQVGDSIKYRVAVYDSKGGDIDFASIYGLSSGVGDKGVSWQNETFEQQDN